MIRTIKRTSQHAVLNGWMLSKPEFGFPEIMQNHGIHPSQSPQIHLVPQDEEMTASPLGLQHPYLTPGQSLVQFLRRQTRWALKQNWWSQCICSYQCDNWYDNSEASKASELRPLLFSWAHYNKAHPQHRHTVTNDETYKLQKQPQKRMRIQSMLTNFLCPAWYFVFFWVGFLRFLFAFTFPFWPFPPVPCGGGCGSRQYQTFGSRQGCGSHRRQWKLLRSCSSETQELWPCLRKNTCTCVEVKVYIRDDICGISSRRLVGCGKADNFMCWVLTSKVVMFSFWLGPHLYSLYCDLHFKTTTEVSGHSRECLYHRFRHLACTQEQTHAIQDLPMWSSQSHRLCYASKNGNNSRWNDLKNMDTKNI